MGAEKVDVGWAGAGIAANVKGCVLGVRQVWKGRWSCRRVVGLLLSFSTCRDVVALLSWVVMWWLSSSGGVVEW